MAALVSRVSVGRRLCHVSRVRQLLSRSSSAVTRYDRAATAALTKPADFWAEAADKLVWEKKWTQVLDNSKQPFTRWFVGGELNTCYNCVDRHVDEGFGDQVAIYYDSPVTNTKAALTYQELQKEVSLFAGVLLNSGVQRGDRVLIYLPMIPQAIVAMLASARIGAIHSLVFGGFAARELSTRISHAKPTVVVSANCGVEPSGPVYYKPILDEAIQLSGHVPNKCIIYNRPGFVEAPLTKGRDISWQEAEVTARPTDCVPVSATDPLYLLYTSGTTGLPKAVVRPSGGHAVALNWSMNAIYGMQQGEVWWTASDLGWVVGHSYICYAPLLNRNSTVLFEGKPIGTPDSGTFFRILHEYGPAGWFLAPTALRAIRKEDPKGEYASQFSYPSLRNIFVAGEHCDPETLRWTEQVSQRPVLDHWWQTESGFPITSTCVGLGNSLSPPSSTAGKAVPGWDIQVLREDGSRCKTNELGNIVAKLPLPPPASSSLYLADEKFQEVYFSQYEGYYSTMDCGYVDEEGYVFVMGRTDDVINVAAHRLSSGQLEEVILSVADVADAAVIGQKDEVKGQVPFGFIVLSDKCRRPVEEVKADVAATVREKVGKIATLRTILPVKRLPKTRSGKIARSTLAALVNGQPFKVPVTIDDPSVYVELRDTLGQINIETQAPS